MFNVNANEQDFMMKTFSLPTKLIAWVKKLTAMGPWTILFILFRLPQENMDNMDRIRQYCLVTHHHQQLLLKHCYPLGN